MIINPKCSWDNCKSNNGEYCTCQERITLLNIRVQGNDYLTCANYEEKETN
jgi:hypothetical protein